MSRREATKSSICIVAEYCYLRMTYPDVPELLRERQNVNAKRHRAEPLGYRASYVQLPAAVLLVPFPRIRSCNALRECWCTETRDTSER